METQFESEATRDRCCSISGPIWPARSPQKSATKLHSNRDRGPDVFWLDAVDRSHCRRRRAGFGARSHVSPIVYLDGGTRRQFVVSSSAEIICRQFKFVCIQRCTRVGSGDSRTKISLRRHYGRLASSADQCNTTRCVAQSLRGRSVGR